MSNETPRTSLFLIDGGSSPAAADEEGVDEESLGEDGFVDAPASTVIDGASEPTERRARAPALTLLPPPIATHPQQLSLPLVASRPERVISLSLGDCEPGALEAIIVAEAPRVAIDVRFSPGFSTWGLTRPVFNQMMARYGVAYRCYPSLANRFVGQHLDYSRTLVSYAAYLEQPDAAAELDALVADIASGPVLLIGSIPAHQGSERRVLLDLLAARGHRFELVLR